jgi:hypothetical protein
MVIPPAAPSAALSCWPPSPFAVVAPPQYASILSVVLSWILAHALCVSYGIKLRKAHKQFLLSNKDEKRRTTANWMTAVGKVGE